VFAVGRQKTKGNVRSGEILAAVGAAGEGRPPDSRRDGGATFAKECFSGAAYWLRLFCLWMRKTTIRVRNKEKK
jgi:hypothetical protein